MSNTKVHVAVVGLGFMGVTHLKAYQMTPAARISAVCDAVRFPVNGVLAGVTGNIKRSDDIDLGRDVKVYRRIEDVVADPEVQLVDLCTPTPLHPEQAIMALKAGKHVLCEKPIARTSAQGREILEVTKSSKGFLMPAMCMRFWPGWAWLKDVVREQKYGAIYAARFRRVSEMPAWGGATYGSDMGGALFDLHIHDVDFVQYLFGRPKGVFSTGVSLTGKSYEHVVTQYLYPNGPIVSAEGGWLLKKGFNMAFTISCERASIDYDLSRGAEALHVQEHGQDSRVVPLGSMDGYNGEVQYIVNCVQQGTPPQVVTCEEGVSALEICEAEERSARTGQIVSL
jgi:predicted dehydrogenase